MENRFTGWTDVDLSERGVSEAHRAVTQLHQSEFQLHHRKFEFEGREARVFDLPHSIFERGHVYRSELRDA